MKTRDNHCLTILVFLAATVIIVSCVAALVGCVPTDAPLRGKMDGEPTEAGFMTEAQLREYEGLE